MNSKYLVLLLIAFATNTGWAAHIVTETRQGSTPITRTDTYANASGDLRVEERRFGSSSSASASASSGSSNSTVEYHLGKTEDIMLYQSKGNAFVVLEGSTCRRLTADSKPPMPFGLPGMDMSEANAKMNEAMKQAGAAMEEAMAQARKDGMTAEQQRQIEQFTKPFTQPKTIKPDNTLEIYKLGEKTRVGNYSAVGYGVRDLNGIDKHRVWVVSVSEIPGGKHVRKAMRGMFETFSEFLDKMGGGALMDTGLSAMFEKPELAAMYPVRIEDLDSGEVTDVIEASSGGSAEYYPECEVKDMFGM